MTAQLTDRIKIPAAFWVGLEHLGSALPNSSTKPNCRWLFSRIRQLLPANTSHYGKPLMIYRGMRRSASNSQPLCRQGNCLPVY
jgi:hypothetical protein